MTEPGSLQSPSAPPPPDDAQRQLAALREELRAALRALKMEVCGLLEILGRDPAGLALLPLRLMLGLPLAVGTFWGLWRALPIIFG